MQIVINIPDFVYNGIRNMTEGKGIIEYNAKALYDAIYYGTPLPKHGRLIDADEYAEEKVTTVDDVLDKIRAEIEQITDTMGVSYNQYVSKIDVLQIIDKYKAESENEK